MTDLIEIGWFSRGSWDLLHYWRARNHMKLAVSACWKIHPKTDLSVIGEIRNAAFAYFTRPKSELFKRSPRGETTMSEVPKIIDVSSWRQRIEHQKVYDAGVRMAICRQGASHVSGDMAYAYNVREFEKVGILTPSYHYFYPDYDPIFQADCIVASHQGKSSIHVIDLERQQGPLGSVRAGRVKLYLDVIEGELGLAPLIYTNRYHWNEYYARWAGWAGAYDLWLAYYTTGTVVKLPNGFAQYELWQYSKYGRVPGIDGNVDFNRPRPCGWLDEITRAL